MTKKYAYINKLNTIILLVAATLVGAVNAGPLGPPIAVTASTAAASAGTANGADVQVTVSDWGLNGGNAVVALFGAENSDGITTVTYDTQPMTLVNVFDGDRFVSSFAYLINPTASTGDVVINANNSGASRLSNAYAVISLSNVGSFAGSDTLTAAGNLDYTTTLDGGYVLLGATNNNWSGPAPTITATNADLTLFSAAVDGNQSTIFAHGDVATAGGYSEVLSGSTETGILLAFDAATIPEPSTIILAGLGLTGLVLRRRRK